MPAGGLVSSARDWGLGIRILQVRAVEPVVNSSVKSPQCPHRAIVTGGLTLKVQTEQSQRIGFSAIKFPHTIPQEWTLSLSLSLFKLKS